MFDFPNSPTVNQTVTSPGGTYRWDGAKWVPVGSSTGGPPGTVTNVTAGVGLTGGTITTTGTIALSAPVTVANGGTGASTAGAALTALGAAPLASPAFTGTPSMPTGTTAVTQATGTSNTTLATTAFVQAAEVPALNATGRNFIHNPAMSIQQRGAGPWTTNGAYTVDRWLMSLANDTVSVTPATLVDADRTAIGDESATSALQAVFTGSATAGSLSFLAQRIEYVRRFSGKTVTVSFWARASSGTPRIGGLISQNFGSGGSPSATTNTTLAATPALSTTWTRYTMSGAFPSAAGKTFGSTVGTDFSTLGLWLSDQGNASGTAIGVQSGTVQFWGVQLELGPTMTPFAQRDPQQDVALCQRFFCVSYAYLVANGTASATFGTVGVLPVTMRAAPTIVATSNSNTNWTYSGGAGLAGNATAYIYGTATATGATTIGQGFTASADL